MGVSLRSTKVLLYQARDTKSGIVTMKLMSSNHNAYDNSFSSNIQDSCVTPASEGVLEKEDIINSNFMTFTAAEIAAAEDAIGDIPTPPLADFTEAVILMCVKQKMDVLKLYGSTSSDWELVSDSVAI